MNRTNMNLSRRTLLSGAAAAAAVSMMPKGARGAKEAPKAPAKPNSVFGGVQIGVITYSYRSVRGPATNMLNNITRSGI
ncbi:MAG: sugar phosphate isomerase/epimerase, partial [Phycisphaerae bacterium]|nr:sugar phosphate isomerase/epimerase [Phycisphaerae bacterium]